MDSLLPGGILASRSPSNPAWLNLPELEFGGAHVFVMPGPYERADRVTAALEQLPCLLAE